MATTGKLGTSDSKLGNIQLAREPSSGNAFVRGASSSIGVSVGLSRTETIGRALLTSLPSTIQISRAAGYSRDASSSVQSSSGLSRLSAMGRSLGFGAAPSATLGRQVGFVRSQAASVASGISVTGISQTVRGLSSSVASALTVIRGSASSRAITWSRGLVVSLSAVLGGSITKTVELKLQDRRTDFVLPDRPVLLVLRDR